MRMALFGVISTLALCGTAFGQSKPAQTAQPAQPAQPAPPVAAAAAGAPLKPGLWELTTVIEVAGSASKRTVVARACYGPADVADLQRILPKQREFGMQCENRDAKAAGSAATWTVACTSKEASLTGSGKLSFAGTTYDGRVELEQKKRGAKPVKVEQTVSGKWIEACK